VTEAPKPERARTIAISRQRGSGGAYVGRVLAERLDLLYIDRQMLRDAAEYLCEREAKQNAEPPPASWWLRLGQSISVGGLEYAYVPPAPETIYEGDLFNMQNRVMQEIAEEQAAVIVGRGAAQALHGRAGVLSIFLHAPEPWRLARVQQVYNVTDPRQAEQMVRESDRDRSRFIRNVADRDWTDVRNYDLTIDTAAIGLDAAVDLIVRAADARAA
jgi:cytidylate kinase